MTSRLYQRAVIATGLALWLAAAFYLIFYYAGSEQLAVLTLVPLAVVVSLFMNTFPLPLGLKFTNVRTSVTLTDAIILLIACWYGLPAAIFVGGIEGFAASRRTTRRMSSVLFSSAMIALTSGAAALSLNLVLHRPITAFGVDGADSFLNVTVAFLVASVVHIIVNTGLLSTFLALRAGDSVFGTWYQNFAYTAPIFLPTSAAASVMYLTVRFHALSAVIIGVPVLLAIYLGQRQSRISVQQRMEAMEKAHRETIEALAVAINAKDEVTHEHVQRVQIYAAGVARLLGCTESEIEALKAGALLHDIGKIAVPDHILYKPTKLTAAEFDVMKIHTVVGSQILGRVEFPYPVVPIVRHHHERWDGKGYPDALRGEDIPLTARILSVVDCFDAVREDRQYRKGMTREEAVGLIMSGSGTQYDPRVVGTFITNLPAFEAEIQAMRHKPTPTFGIEPVEKLSSAALSVTPAAGVLVEKDMPATKDIDFSHAELKALYRLAQSLSEARTAKEMAESFTNNLAPLVPYDTCSVTTVTPKSGDIIVTHAAGRHASLLLGKRVALDAGVTGWVIANRKPLCNTNPKLDLPREHAAEFEAYRTLAVFPLVKDEKMYGAVALYSATLPE
ncbi:MAG TPA: HD domain-containing phosphohydrolase, partial [Pyrinomonadaceae bacterium]|nr:HD domain-containing phosphohydrolase [Pyrinomonadaceae bacterium]